MLATYRLSETEYMHRLRRLDRLKLIDLLPGNRAAQCRQRFRLVTGTIRRFFRDKGQSDFLSAKFDGTGEMHTFVHGMLIPAAAEELQAQLRRLRLQFDELHRESSGNRLPDAATCKGSDLGLSLSRSAHDDNEQQRPAAGSTRSRASRCPHT